MKKLLIFVVMLLATLPASARVVSGARDTCGFKFGMKGSFTLNSMNHEAVQYGYMLKENGDGIIKIRPLTSFAVGFAMDFPILESLHLNIELKYELKGHKVTAEDKYVGTIENYSIVERNGYLELPIQPQFRLNFSSKSHLNFNVGPYIAFALHGNLQQYIHVANQGDIVYKYYTFTRHSEKKTIWDNTNDVKTPYSRFDVGFAFGIDYVYNKFHIGASYDLGTKNIYKLEVDRSMVLFRPIKNRTALFTVGWDF